jgi:hypothetical protein
MSLSKSKSCSIGALYSDLVVGKILSLVRKY